MRLALVLTLLLAACGGPQTEPADAGSDAGDPESDGGNDSGPSETDAGPCAVDAICDDGDACTEADRCDAIGACVGRPRLCDSPPPGECIGDVLRAYPGGVCTTGDCVYEPVDQRCDAGCEVVEGLAQCVVPTYAWVQVSAGHQHTCLRHRDGSLLCWGSNEGGQLGVGEFGGRRTAPADVMGITNASDVDAGGNHTCALVDGGRVACWGSGSSGQLGDGERTRSASPVFATTIDDATDVCAGSRYTCAVRADRSLWCWGYKSAGMLIGEPEQVVGLTEVADVSCHGQYQCVRRTDGEVLCWGYGPAGELGYDSFDERTPMRAGGITDASAIFTGMRQTCAIRPSGFECWGFNESGQLGRGSNEPNDDFNPMATLFGSAANPVVSMGGSFHSTCVLLQDGSAECIGQNSHGSLGNRRDSDSLTPVGVYGLTGARELAMGNGHACTLVGDQLWCWGLNYDGQLGRGNRDNALEPIEALLPAR